MIESRNIKIDISDKAKELVAKEGFDPIYGARPLKRVIQNEIQNVLAMKILNGEIKEGNTVIISTTGPEDKKLDFKIS